jgi:hypothetical protein
VRRLALSLAMVAAAAAGGCVENTAPGNDREAELEPPAPAAALASAGAAISGVETGLLKPEIMTDADVGVVGGAAQGCRFRMTRVGLPVFLFPAEGRGDGVLKLNGKLIRLPQGAGGAYSADGVEVALRELDDRPDDGEPFSAEMVLRLPWASHELGFHGFAEC